MKTEDFDDAMRQKLHSIQPTYKENEIDRVHNFVSKKNPVTFNAKYGKAILFSAAGLVIASLIILNIIQLQKHDKLVEKIDTLEIRQEQLLKKLSGTGSESDSAIPETELKKAAKKNTLNEYQNPKEEIINSNNSLKTNTTTETDFSQKPLANKEEFNAEQNNANYNAGKININNNKKSNKTVVTEKENAVTKGTKIKDKNNNFKIAENNKLSENKPETNDLQKTGNEAIKDGNKTIDSGILIVDSEIKADSVSTDSTASVAIKNEKKIPVTDLQKEDNKSSKNLFSKLQFSIGLSAEKANRFVGFGIPVQIAFSDNWSIYSGIKLAKTTDVKYRDEREYTVREGKDIRLEYNAPPRDSGKIANIERTKKLVQLPLALAYHIPLKNNFGILLSGGTDINLSAFHSIHYELMHRSNTPMTTKEISNIKRPVPLFNNANVSVGIQKQWESITLQANPYLMRHFRKTINNNPDPAFIPGINFRLLYNI